MAKKQKEMASRERIAIFFKKHTDVIKGSPQVNCPNYTVYAYGHIVWDDSEIERLTKAGAPISVYYKDVNRATES